MLESFIEESDDLKETTVDLLVRIARLLTSSESSYVAIDTLRRLILSRRNCSESDKHFDRQWYRRPR